MPAARNPDTRERLLRVTADLVAARPGQDVPLREICEGAGVQLPTLYHHFGSKQGLLDAVVDHGFDLYLQQKSDAPRSTDPLDDIRSGWDTHVAFGVANPGFYLLTYGQVAPGGFTGSQKRPEEVLRTFTDAAEERGLLTVPSAQAAAHIMATSVGTTLRFIVTGDYDADLSAQIREATVAGISGATGPSPAPRTDQARALLRTLEESPLPLAGPEVALLRYWLQQL